MGFCDFLEQELEIETQIIAFVPFRLLFQQRKKMAKYNRKIKVIPVINRYQSIPWYSRLNAKLVRMSKPGSIMTRNPSALHVCLEIQKGEVPFFYDARGCMYKELEEFSETEPGTIKEMMNREQDCFKKADWVFSVSRALINYFKDNHRYNDHNHSIIPCCVIEDDRAVKHTKTELFGTEDVTVFCYAGALSVWNYPRSFTELCRYILKEKQNRLIILSHELDRIEDDRLFKNDRVLLRKVKSTEVSAYLNCSDHAILLRKQAVTNQVASPSKFGEYLLAGCRVVISPEIGDFSSMVESLDLGIVFRGKKDKEMLKSLGTITDKERERIKKIARATFLRNSEMNLIRYRNLKKLHDGH